MNINSKGQSLIEVLAGLAMAVLIVAALINMVTASLRSSQFAKTTSQATKYAQESIEWLRSQRDSLGWAGFISQSLGDSSVLNKTWCLKETKWPTISSSCGATDFICYGDCSEVNSTIFKRQLAISRESADATRVNIKITVSWSDQAIAEHKSELETILSDTGKWK